MNPAAIESLTPVEGNPDRESTGAEWTAWAMRRRLPSEHAHRVVLRWPGDVSDVTNLPECTLKQSRAEGDCPRLYAIGRALFTTRADLLAWFEAHEVEPGQVMRPATIPRGTKLTRTSRVPADARVAAASVAKGRAKRAAEAAQ